MEPHQEIIMKAIWNHKKNFPELFYALGYVSLEWCQQFLEQALHANNAFVLDFFYKQNVTFKHKHYLFLCNERKNNKCLEYFLHDAERKNVLMRQNFFSMGVDSPIIFQACRYLPPNYIRHFLTHFDVNCKNELGITPLFAAIYGFNFETIRYLIRDCGAEVNYYCKYLCCSPLEFTLHVKEIVLAQDEPDFMKIIQQKEIEKTTKISSILLLLGANWPQKGFPIYFNYYPLCLLLYCFKHKNFDELCFCSLDLDIFFHL